MNATTLSSTAFQNLKFVTPLNLQKCRNEIKNRTINLYSDKDIIDGIRLHNTIIIKYLYNKFYSEISFMVTSNSGTTLDAEDLFQDALVIIYEKISTESLQLMSSFNTYLYSICWHLWLQRLNKHEHKYESKENKNIDAYKGESDPDELLLESEKFNLFHRHFLRLSHNEQKVLRLYMDKSSSKETANIMGYKSDDYAKSRKYICKEKLKNFIIKDPLFKNIYQSA
jgi:RNA polymerase sigma factor (sigma-70 family)